MIKGIYSSSSGMGPRSLRLEVIGNNLANINTTGYKRDNIFVQVMKNAKTIVENSGNDLEGFDVVQYTDHGEGSFMETHNTLDVAIQGNGYFAIDTPKGIRYTRNGNFSLSLDGTLITQNGYPVLGKTGKIQLPDVQKLSQSDVVITSTGEIVMNNSIVGALRLVTFEDIGKLKKEGATLFVSTVQGKDTDANGNGLIIRQGFLEESNVEGIEEMIQMIELSRSFESDQKAIQYQDETLERAMDMGRL